MKNHYYQNLIEDHLKNYYWIQSVEIIHNLFTSEFFTWMEIEIEINESFYIMEVLLGNIVDFEKELRHIVPTHLCKIYLIINGKREEI